MPDPLVDPPWWELQRAIALDAGVLVIGPGGHRIGFDRSEEWLGVVVPRVAALWSRLGDDGTDPKGPTAEDLDVRRSFLRRFWLEQLSPETRHASAETAPRHNFKKTNLPEERSLPKGQDIEQEGAEALPGENGRIALAGLLLCGLVECTRCLGSIVARGDVPVDDWQEVAYAARASRKDDAAAAWRKAREWLKDAADLASTLSREPESDGLAGMKIQEISTSLQVLIESRFELDQEPGLSGAVIEWLSDLLWHVIVSGSQVPPSRGELDFFVNLHQSFEPNDVRRRFSRPHPGEYRETAQLGVSLLHDFEALLSNYPSGTEEPEPDWQRARENFACTIAATLLASWRAVPAPEGPPRDIPAARERRPIVPAIIFDYDLMIERALLGMLQEGEGFHVLIPATVDPARPFGADLEWLFGTCIRGQDPVELKQLTEPAWEWFDHVGPAHKSVRGPILIKLNGSPLHKLGKRVEIGLREYKEYKKQSDELVAVPIFSERDALRAIKRLPLDRKGNSLKDDLLGPRGLSWQDRSWLFFGLGLSEWLPRLQLLLAALMLAETNESRDNLPRIAFDREFDWPEQALLRALNITPYRSDLAVVAEYFSRRTTWRDAKDDKALKVQEFLATVTRLVAGETAGKVESTTE